MRGDETAESVGRDTGPICGSAPLIESSRCTRCTLVVAHTRERSHGRGTYIKRSRTCTRAKLNAPSKEEEEPRASA